MIIGSCTNLVDHTGNWGTRMQLWVFHGILLRIDGLAESSRDVHCDSGTSPWFEPPPDWNMIRKIYDM